MILTDFDYATVSETKAGLSGLLKRLKETHRALAVTSHGKPAGILMDFEEYRRLATQIEEMEATLEVLGDPEMYQGLKNAIAREKTGKYYTLDEVFGKKPAPKAPASRRK